MKAPAPRAVVDLVHVSHELIVLEGKHDNRIIESQVHSALNKLVFKENSERLVVEEMILRKIGQNTSKMKMVRKIGKLLPKRSRKLLVKSIFSFFYFGNYFLFFFSISNRSKIMFEKRLCFEKRHQKEKWPEIYLFLTNRYKQWLMKNFLLLWRGSKNIFYRRLFNKDDQQFSERPFEN